MWVNRKRFEALEERVDRLSSIIYVAVNDDFPGLTDVDNFFARCGRDALKREIESLAIVRTEGGTPVSVAAAFNALIEAHGNRLEWINGTKGKAVIK